MQLIFGKCGKVFATDKLHSISVTMYRYPLPAIAYLCSIYSLYIITEQYHEKTTLPVCGSGVDGLWRKNKQAPIDREALVDRNSPQVTAFDSLSIPVSRQRRVCLYGRCYRFADISPELHTKGVPLGTQSQWGWHEFTNPEAYRHEETLKDYDFGRGRMEPYSVQFNDMRDVRKRLPTGSVSIPICLHLGMVGFEFGRDPLPRWRR